jgi:hypothetical protein
MNACSKRKALWGGWAQLRDEEIHNLFSSPDIIRKMRGSEHVTCMEELKNHKGRDFLGELGINERTIRACIQKFPDWPPGAVTANGTAVCH